MAVRVYKGGEYRRWDLLGLSCFCGWVYASFFTKAISLKGPAGTMVLDGFWLASLFSVTVGLGLGVAMPRITIRLAENQAGRTGAAVFMVIGTLMMSLSTLIDMSPFKACRRCPIGAWSGGALFCLGSCLRFGRRRSNGMGHPFLSVLGNGHRACRERDERMGLFGGGGVAACNFDGATRAFVSARPESASSSPEGASREAGER